MCSLCAKNHSENQQLNPLHINHINIITIITSKKYKVKNIEPAQWVYFGTDNHKNIPLRKKIALIINYL